MKIENEFLSLEVSLQAAEMHSLIDKRTSKELLWEGDPAYWAGRNPILFPIIGSTFDKKIHLFEKVYEMGNHGFTRNSLFSLVSHTKDKIVLLLKADEKTLAQYPFLFKLQVTYTLVDHAVNIDYLIINDDEKKMPFSFGLHPAFAIDSPDNALVEFPVEEDYPFLSEGRLANMNDEFFSTDSSSRMEYINSLYIDLVRKDVRVRVSCEGYRWVVFWKKPGASFLCIEPWHGHGDFEETTTDFYQREGTFVLDPQETYTTSYSITVL